MSTSISQSIIQTNITHSEYGKSFVKLLALRREGSVHHIMEVEVNTALTLDDDKDYVYADNSDVVATDSQKNTVYILARKYGIENIESFAMRLCNHFLQTYKQFVHAHMHIKQYPWRRIEMNGREHVHAFVSNPDVVRFCDVKQARRGQPIITAGITDLKILKTAQSSFENFVDDEYRTLPYSKDRLFCTIIQSKWTYNTIHGIDFSKTWETVKDTILTVFVGPPDTGRHSPCVQKTVYDSAQMVLNKLPQIEEIQIVLPNVHHFQFDFSKFPRIDFKGSKNSIFVPSDKPSGVINATLKRREKSRL